MKNFIIIFFLFPALAFGQYNLQGKYCSSHAFNASCFTFINDSTFTYFGRTCLAESNGYGKFYIHDNYITFLFISTNSIVKNSSFFSDTTCVSNDSVIFYLHIQDGNDEPMSFAGIRYTNTLDIDTNLVADSLGKADISLKKSTDTMNIIVSYIGHELYLIELVPLNCKNIIVYMTEFFSWDVKDGEIWRYEIIKMSKEKLILKNIFNKQKVYVKSE